MSKKSIVDIFVRFGYYSKDILLSFELDIEIPNIKISVPQIGDKKRLIELSERNAKYYRLEQLKQIKITDPDRHINRIMAKMKKDLRMTVYSRQIEGFVNATHTENNVG